MTDSVLEQVGHKFFRSRHTQLAPLFERLHRQIMALGDDVVAYSPTVYVAYRIKAVFAAIFVRQEGYLDVHLALPDTVENPRLHVLAAPTFRHIAKSVHVASKDDLDEQLLGWLRQAYEGAKVSQPQPGSTATGK